MSDAKTTSNGISSTKAMQGRFFLDIVDISIRRKKTAVVLSTAVSSFTAYPKSISDKLLLSRACFLFNFAAKLQKIFGFSTNYFWHHYQSKFLMRLP